jgi:hypothetical protein
MGKESRLLVIALFAILTGCGGGSGAVATGGSVPPSPPPPEPQPDPAFADSLATQTFTALDAGGHIVLDRTNGQVESATAGPGALTVHYDAGSDSYTVTMSAASARFAPTDLLQSDNTQTIYAQSGPDHSERLTLVRQPYKGTSPTRYVELGYWQHDDPIGGQQDTVLETFVFGFEAPLEAIPRTGMASYFADAVGQQTTPGKEALIFAGRGEFDVDFTTSVYSMFVPVDELGLASGDGDTGYINVTGAGHLSGDGSFSGNALYNGMNGYMSGTMSGRFYGPAAEELGAVFSGTGSSGGTFNGALTGQKTTTTPVNQTLTNLVAEQRFYSDSDDLILTRQDQTAPIQPGTYNEVGIFTYHQDGSFTYDAGTSGLPRVTFTAADRVAGSDPNYTSYAQTVDGQKVAISLYRIGSANTDLALTYLSYGRWRTTEPWAVNGDMAHDTFFVYGIETPARLLVDKTGTAHYDGVAYGAAANGTTLASYDVSGTSHFDVDFSNQNLTGTLMLQGTSTNGNADVDFGTYGFVGSMGYGAETTSTFSHGDNSIGKIVHKFYGPDGEEIGGAFDIRVPADAPGAGTTIAGVALAKRH